MCYYISVQNHLHSSNSCILKVRVSFSFLEHKFVNAYKYSFFVRTVPMWNTLPAAAVQADTIAALKAATGAVV